MLSTFQNSLKEWDVCHHSAENPHSNCRAELAVKAGKKLLRNNTGPGGSLALTGSCELSCNSGTPRRKVAGGPIPDGVRADAGRLSLGFDPSRPRNGLSPWSTG